MGTWVKQKRIDLNPSSADRWTTCTASPKYIFDNWDKLPPEDRKYSDEGNTAHEVAAALLQGRKVNPKECPVPVTPEMNWHGWCYMEFVESLVEPGGTLLVEQKLPLFYMEGRNAIVDAAIINPDNLHIVDYKYGEGVIVSPEENLQATIYAKSVAWNWSKFGFAGVEGPSGGMSWAFDKPDNFPVSVTIYQPRTRNDAPFHTWSTTWGNVRDKARSVFNIAQRIQAANISGESLVFAPSDKACQFCPAKGFCPARPALYAKDLEQLAVMDGRDLPAGRVLTETQLAAIVRHGDAIKKWIDDAQEFALQLMRGGGKIPGFKLVTGRGGNRAWADPDKAAKYLKEDTILRDDEIYTKKVVGPAQVEKMIGKGKFPKRVFNLITKSPGQPIIVPEDDPRESALVDGASEFTNLDAPSSRALDEF